MELFIIMVETCPLEYGLSRILTVEVFIIICITSCDNATIVCLSIMKACEQTMLEHQVYFILFIK